MTVAIAWKVCAHCGKTKTVGSFSRAPSNSDGLQTWCNACQRERNMRGPVRRRGTPVRKRTSPYQRAADKMRLIEEAIRAGDTDRALGIIERVRQEWRVA